jgi:serine/threonine protein kinase
MPAMNQDSSGAPCSRGMSSEIPSVAIPNFEMLRPIGGGSYGKVWLARNVLGEYRAVKLVRRVEFQENRPYDREFEGICRMEQVTRRHPGLVDVLHAGRGEGFFYYVMELADDANAESVRQAGVQLEGDPAAAEVRGAFNLDATRIDGAGYALKTLRWLLRAHSVTGMPPPEVRPATAAHSDGSSEAARTEQQQQSPPSDLRHALPASQSLGIALALTDALAFLHKNGLVHRDIKPSNVIFVHGQPKLADIGLVAEADGDCSFVGTEGYVAPEGPGKPQADLYALGMVLYEMLTGLRAKEYPKLPDGWAESAEHAKLNELNQVVLKACEPDLKKRYHSAEEMRCELELLNKDRSLLRLRRLERLTRLMLFGLVVALVALGWVLYVLQLDKTRATELLSRAKEESVLRQVAQSQLAGPAAGWASSSWSRLVELARPGMNPEIVTKAVTLLAGLDAQRESFFDRVSGFSAAFAPDGSVIVSGEGTNQALLIDPNGTGRSLPITEEGPVCWPSDGVPLQFLGVSNRLVLREARTSAVRREFAVPGPAKVTTGPGVVLAITPDGRFVAAGLGGSLLGWESGGRLPAR